MMRFWPSLNVLDVNKPRALWQFATRAIRDEVRRRLFSRSRLREREATRLRYIQLVRADMDGHGLPEVGVELEATKTCFLSMTPAEARYYRMVYEYRQRLAPRHLWVLSFNSLVKVVTIDVQRNRGVTCAHCRAGVTGARVICLDCHAPRGTLDFCDRAECLAVVIGLDRRPDLTSPHLPSHRLLKVRKVIHRHRELGGTYRAAHDALLRAEEALSDAKTLEFSHVKDDSSKNVHDAEALAQRIVGRELSCIACRSRVTRPCWYCVECEGTSPAIVLSFMIDIMTIDAAFLCAACEASSTGTKGKHKPMHSLVLCQLPPGESKPEGNCSSWLDALEDRFDRIQRFSTLRLDALEKKIDILASQTSDPHPRTSDETELEQRLDALDGRMQKIENMLSMLLTKLS